MHFVARYKLGFIVVLRFTQMCVVRATWCIVVKANAVLWRWLHLGYLVVIVTYQVHLICTMLQCGARYILHDALLFYLDGSVHCDAIGIFSCSVARATY